MNPVPRLENLGDEAKNRPTILELFPIPQKPIILKIIPALSAHPYMHPRDLDCRFYQPGITIGDIESHEKTAIYIMSIPITPN